MSYDAIIGAGRLASNSVSSANIQAGAVGNTQLGGGSVDSAKIASDAITPLLVSYTTWQQSPLVVNAFKGWYMLQAKSNGTALYDPLVTGTPVTSGTLASDRTGTRPYISHTTLAVIDTESIVRTIDAYNDIMFNWKPGFLVRVKTGPDITNQRIMIGLFTADPMGADTIATNGIYFRYSTAAGDTTWRLCRHNGTTFNSSIVGPAIAANTEYYLWIENPLDGSFPLAHVLPIGGTRTQILVTSSPFQNVAGGFHAGIRTLDAVAKTLLLSKAHIHYGV